MLETIGQKLKAAREAQGLSLRQIYERTKIPINHLQSIDAGQTDDLPEPVYVAGFIKRYADCIGLDGQGLASEYRRKVTPQETGNSNGNGNGRSKQPLPAPNYTSAEYLRHSRVDQSPPTYKLWLFNALIIIGLMAILAWYTQANNNNQQDPSLQSLKETAKIPEGVAATTTGSAKPNQEPTTGTATATSQEPAGANGVSVTVNKHVWVEVKGLSNGGSLFTGSLEKGDHKEFQDPQGLRIRVGNAGSVSVEFKGKMEPFGTEGKIAERTFVTGSAPKTATQTAGSGTATTASTGTKSATTAASSGSTRSQPSSSGAAGTGTTNSSLTQAAATAGATPPKRIKHDSVKPVRAHHSDETTARTTEGDSSGGGDRAIEVPYQSGEGRLDSN